MKIREEIKSEGNKKGGNPLWNAYTDPITGESTYQEITPKEVNFCKEHYYEYIDPNGNIQCKRCPVGGRLIIGINHLKEGKIIKLASGNTAGL